MSDSDSFRSSSPTTRVHERDTNTDDRLDDHRHQPTALPYPPGSVESEPPGMLESNRPQAFPSGQSYDTRNTTSNTSRIPRRGSRSQSFSEHGGLNPKDARHLNVTGGSGGGILRNSSTTTKRKKPRSNSNNNDNLEADLASPMMKVKTNDTHQSRRPSRSSIDSDADSHGSRTSQETEEDVCFPMLREHVRVNGIDFDEIDEFINEERDNERALREQQQLIAERIVNDSAPGTNTKQHSMSSSQSRHYSAASLKYTPKHILKRTTTALGNFKDKEKSGDDIKDTNDEKDKSNHPSESSTMEDADDIKPTPLTQTDDASSDSVKFGGARLNEGNNTPLPERFSFFSSHLEETIHAPDIPSLVEPNESIKDTFNNGEGTWWLDCSCPTDAEMKVIFKAFGLHPLTSEDIRMQETREKVELFKNYYFVCFHTFEPDKESVDYLEPINVYIVVFREGILSFHFSPINHPPNVRRRVRQLRDYVDVSADWLCYAIIDDITDAFIPVITAIEYEADAIEDSVFVTREIDFGSMLHRIGESRRKVMTLMRLLSGKADVIKMFAKRCQDEVIGGSHALHGLYHPDSGTGAPQANAGSHYPLGYNQFGSGISFGPNNSNTNNNRSGGLHTPGSNHNQYNIPPGSIAQPRADIALYLGDIQDHVVTMFQNLLAYEKIFSRSHSNYLAQLQVESVNANNKTTELLSTVTLIGTILVPLNLVTGLFGMNVTVPGEATGSLGWFFGILGIMVFIAILFFLIAKIWLDKLTAKASETDPDSSRSIRSFGLRRTRSKTPAKSIVSFPNYD